MMDNQEAAALLIENIDMFEQATLLLNEIEKGERIKNAVKQKIKDWVSNSDGEWLFDDETLDDKGEVYFMHKSCELNKEGSWIAYFHLTLEFADKDKQDCWLLTSYCGKGKNRYGIRFAFEPKSFDEVTSRKELKKYFQQKSEEFTKLQKNEFKFQGTDEGWWFLPFNLDAKKLASAYSGNTFEDALVPIEQALNKVKDAWPEFKRLVDATAEKFPNSGS